MFQRFTLDRPGGPANPIDLGVLAECLVFYETVRVIVDGVTFGFLVTSCGAEHIKLQRRTEHLLAAVRRQVGLCRWF
jgi:hypothetical protein